MLLFFGILRALGPAGYRTAGGGASARAPAALLELLIPRELVVERGKIQVGRGVPFARIFDGVPVVQTIDVLHRCQETIRAPVIIGRVAKLDLGKVHVRQFVDRHIPRSIHRVVVGNRAPAGLDTLHHKGFHRINAVGAR